MTPDVLRLSLYELFINLLGPPYGSQTKLAVSAMELIKVSAQTKHTDPDDLAAGNHPIELLTENGYAIVRIWEINQTPAPINGSFPFRVQKEEEDLEREIVVMIAPELYDDICLRTQGKVSKVCSFWISCAERHLANHLWEKEEYPAGNILTIDRLNPDDIMAAVNWRIHSHH